MASLAADQLIFNSKWNLDSFLENMNTHLKIIPDFRHDIEQSDILLGTYYDPGTYYHDTLIILTYAKKDQKI